jgi:hypothetical protein
MRKLRALCTPHHFLPPGPFPVGIEALTREPQMEIHKMLCLSTAHLTFSTRMLLEQDELQCSIFFPKDSHGWFMHVPEPEVLQATLIDAPPDVRDCLTLACARGFQWLMFDSDGPTLNELSLYEEIDLDAAATQALDRMTMGYVANVLMQPLSQG